MKNILSVLALSGTMFLASCSFFGGSTSTQTSAKLDSKAEIKTEVKAPVVEANPRYEISVYQKGALIGTIKLETFPKLAPKHARNFDSLVSVHFYDGTAFHRVIPGFMIQGGDPNTKNKPESVWGQGDPSQTMVPAEFSATKHVRGILSAARRGNNVNSATSQFFICVTEAASLDGQYTVYGQVLEGMEVADMIVNTPRGAGDRPNDKIEMKIKRINNK